MRHGYSLEYEIQEYQCRTRDRARIQKWSAFFSVAVGLASVPGAMYVERFQTEAQYLTDVPFMGALPFNLAWELFYQADCVRDFAAGRVPCLPCASRPAPTSVDWK